MAQFKESKDNPLFHKYGFVSNTGYILRKMAKYTPFGILCGSVEMVTSSVMGYFWVFIGKYVLDIVLSDASAADKEHGLLVTVGVGLAVSLTLSLLRTFASGYVWPIYIRCRMWLIHERIEKVLQLDYELLERPEMLDMHDRATHASGNNRTGLEGMMHLLQDIGKNLITVIVCTVAVSVLDWRLIIALTLLTLTAFYFYRRTFLWDKREIWDRLPPVRRKLSYMERVTQDFDYAKDIRLFSMRDFLLAKQHSVHLMRESYIIRHNDTWLVNILRTEGLSLIGKLLIYVVLFFAVLRDTDKLSVSNFTLYLGLAISFSAALQQMLEKFGNYLTESLKVDDFRSFMDSKGDEPEDPLPVPTEGELEFEFHNVSYRYFKSEKDALSGLDLKLRPGEKLAVVGLNGAGKTTMIKLLLRLYDPTEGFITLNGTDIRRFRKAEYYRLFSPVFQNVELFAATLAENISMRPHAMTDMERAAACLEQAGLGDKLKELKKGLDSQVLKVVDEDGIDLSGGEKQKLALARALYKGAPVVVLDEPTAALDAIAEKQLYERFDTMIGRRSAVYISHRLASTRFCDNIAMFADGHMAEYGTHDELIARNGEYARMFDVQAQYYRENEEGGEQDA